jgi:enoyl-CoA hydratase/carnithine racemase
VSETLVTHYGPGVAILTLNRPSARNALNGELLTALEGALTDIAADRSIGTLVFRGAGSFFCAGGDVKERTALPLKGHAESLESRSRREGELLARVDRQPQLTLAAVHGGAMGAGLGIVCACDICIATEDAVFNTPEVRAGKLPAQIAPLIVRSVGWRHARKLLLAGERIGAQEARHIGLVHEVIAAPATLDEAIEHRIADLARCDAAAVADTKALFGSIVPADDTYPAFAADAYVRALQRRR